MASAFNLNPQLVLAAVPNQRTGSQKMADSLKVGQMMREQQSQSQQAQLMRAYGARAFQGDGRALQQIAAAGQPQLAQEIQAKFHANRQTAFEAEDARLQKESRQVGILAAAAYDAETPEDWEQAKRIGVELYGMPQETMQIPFEARGNIIKSAISTPELMNDARKRDEMAMGHQQWRADHAERVRMNNARISSGQLGGVNIVNNMANPSGFGTNGKPFDKKNARDVEAKVISTADQLVRLQRIESAFRPEFHSAMGRLERNVANFTDWLTGGDVSEQDRQLIEEFQNYSTTVYDHINQTLKELSGAAVTPQEAERQMKLLPDMESIFEGPHVAMGKIKSGLQRTRYIMYRYNYWQNTGGVGNPWDIATIGGIPEMIKREGKRLKRQYVSDGMDEAAAETAALTEVDRLFGIRTPQ